MTDEIKKKVIDIFSRADKKDVKFYAGFNYVRIDRDNNGNMLNAERLLKHSDDCHYLVSVMREVNGETVLYNYDVPYSDLMKFVKSFEDNTLDGTIVEIDKYFPEGLI